MNASRLSHSGQLVSQPSTTPDSLPESAKKRYVIIRAAKCNIQGHVRRSWGWKYMFIVGKHTVPSVL